ncbi:MAG: hypothetical protein C4530_01285 [Desulfobacteraceae bacterium]|nr:MAG: hypothetical protein C4530_01285 [Desulfobacteraceae bacterium]
MYGKGCLVVNKKCLFMKGITPGIQESRGSTLCTRNRTSETLISLNENCHMSDYRKYPAKLSFFAAGRQ